MLEKQSDSRLYIVTSGIQFVGDGIEKVLAHVLGLAPVDVVAGNPYATYPYVVPLLIAGRPGALWPHPAHVADRVDDVDVGDRPAVVPLGGSGEVG